MTILRMAVVISVLALEGCAMDRDLPTLRETQSGEQPTVCYVHSHRHRMLVPMSCAEAVQVF
jgi:hypothetical protein